MNKTWSLIASVSCLIAAIVSFVAGTTVLGVVFIAVAVVFGVLGFTVSGGASGTGGI